MHETILRRKTSPDGDPKAARIAEHLSEIERVKEWVATYTNDACEEFLQIGNVSRQCHDLSWQTLEAVGRVLALSNGSDLASPLAKAHATLAASIDAIGGEIERCSEASDELRKALRDLPRMEKLNSSLKDAVAPFRNLRVSSGIDLARLDAKSELELAVLLEAMATLHKRSTSAFESQAIRLKDARKLVLNLDEWVTDRVKALSHTSDRTQELLEEIKAVPGEISSVTGRLLQHMEEISRRTAGLVMALQADDAVRQNLEHVCAMLDQIASSMAAISAGGDGIAAANEQVKWFVHEASAIQLRQLAGIRRKVFDAGEAIGSALGVIVERVVDISAEAREVSISAAETTRQQSTLTHLDAVLDSIYSCYSAPPVVDAEFYRNMDAVLRTSETVVDPAEEWKPLPPGVSKQGRQMAPIGLLSNQAQRAFDDHRLVASEVRLGLNRLAQLSHRFAAEIALAADVQQTQQKELQQLSQSLPQELSEVRQRVSSELNAVCEQCRAVQQETLHLLHGIKFVDQAQEGLQAIAVLLEAIVKDTETGLTAELVSHESRLLIDRLRARYTMENERLLHDGVVGDLGAGGDNVELF